MTLPGLNFLENGTPIAVHFAEPVQLGATDPVYLMTTGTAPQKYTGKAVLDSSGRVLQFIPDESLPLGQTFELHLADVTDISGNKYQDDPAVGPRTFKTFMPYLLWQNPANILTGSKIRLDLPSAPDPQNLKDLTMNEIDFKTIVPDESPDGLLHTTLYGVSFWNSDNTPFQFMTIDFSKPMYPKALSMTPGNYGRHSSRMLLLKDFYLKPRSDYYPVPGKMSSLPPDVQAWTQRVLNYVNNDAGKRICIDPGDNPSKLTNWKSKYCPPGTGCSTRSGGCGDLLLNTSYNLPYSQLRMFDVTDPVAPAWIGMRLLSDNGSVLCTSDEYGTFCPPRKYHAPEGFGMAMGVTALSGLDITHNRYGNAPTTYVDNDTSAAYVANYGVGLAMVDLSLNIPEISDWPERQFPVDPPYSIPVDFETLGTFQEPYYRDVGVVRSNVIAVAGDNTGSGVTTIESFAPDFTSIGMAPLPFIAREMTAVENLYQTTDASGNPVSHDMVFITALNGGLVMTEVAADGSIGGMDTFPMPAGADTHHVEVDKNAMIAYVSARWKDDSGQPVAGILMADLTGTKSVVGGWDSRYIAKIPFTAPDGLHTITDVKGFRIDSQRRLLYAGVDMQPHDSGQVPFAVLKLSAAAFDSASIEDATLDPSTSTSNFPSKDGLLAEVLSTSLANGGKVCVDINIDNATGQQMTYNASERPLKEGKPGYLDFSKGKSGNLTSQLCFDRNPLPAGTDPYPTMLQIDVYSGGNFVRRLFVLIQPASLKGSNARISTLVDRLNNTSCTKPDFAQVYFGLSYDAKVTVKIDGNVLDLTILNSATNQMINTKYQDLQYPAGMHEIDVPETWVSEPGEHSLEITAVFKDSPDVREVYNGTITHEIESFERLPIGHTLVKGVNIYNGQVSLQRSDLSLTAVGPGLQFSRSYSSNGSSSNGPMGAGWSHSYQSRLLNSKCGTHLIGGEGNGIHFNKIQAAPPKYKAQAGYHGELIENNDGTFDFYTKARTRYHYIPSYDPALATKPERWYVLDFIEDTHGNRTQLHYNAASPFALSDVTEMPLDLNGVLVPEDERRKLVFTYTNGKTDAAGKFIGFGSIPEDRIIKVEAFKGSNSLGIELDYDYDQYGNLKTATRDIKIEAYDYYDGNTLDRHNLKQVTDPNGNTVVYNYYAKSDTFPGENADGSLGQAVLAFPEKYEFAKEILAGSGSEQVKTGFVYDFSQHLNRVVTTVSAGLSSPPPGMTSQSFVTTYTMNPRGNVVQTAIQGGNSDGTDNIVNSKWAFDLNIPDVYVKEQTDAAGLKTVFDYDTNGNLLSETVYPPTEGNYRDVTDRNGNPVSFIVTTYTYDACVPTFNKVKTQTDREGNVTENTIDCATGDMLSVTKRSANASQSIVTGYTYWSNGLLKTSTDPNGFLTKYDAYKYDQPEKITAPESLITTDTHDDRGRITDHSDTFGHHTAYTVYDNLDRLRQSIQYSGDTSPDLQVGIDYYPNGQKKSVTGGLGATTYALDTLNRVKEESIDVKDANGLVSTLTIDYAFDANDNKIYQKDRRGIESWFDHDLMNRIVTTKVRNPLTGALVVLDHDTTYDYGGNLTSVKDIHGHETTFASDWLYRSVQTNLPGGLYSIKRTFDRLGNLLSETDANGNKTVMAYDFMNRLVSTADPVGRSTTRQYDNNGNLVRSEQITKSGVTNLVERQDPYDGLNRPTASFKEFKDPHTGQSVSYKTSYAYDDANNIKRVKNETRGIVIAEKSNGLDKVVERIVAEGSLDLKTTYTYDANGNLATVTDPQNNDVDVTNKYDALNRKIMTTFAQTPDDTGPVTEKTFYDGSGNVVKLEDKRGVVTRAEYDFLGRTTKKYLAESISNNNVEVLIEETQYDDAGNKVLVWDANRNKTEQDFNELHQEVRTVDPLGKNIVRTYDGVNKRSEIDRRGIKTGFDYDAVNRLVLTHEYDLSGNEVSRAKTDYEDDENRSVGYDRYPATFTGSVPPAVQTITQLDALGRVRKVSRKHSDLIARYGVDEVKVSETEYDENGNKTIVKNASDHVTRFMYNDADRLHQQTEADGTADAGITTYTYDNVGNVLTVKGPRNHGGAFDFSYIYDARYRKKTEENANNETTTFHYDAVNNLTSVTKPKGHTTIYVYDELGKLLAVDESDGGVGGVTRYAYDVARNKTAQQDANGNLTTYVYDALNRLTDSYQHQAAGTLATDSVRGAGGDITTAFHWRFGYDENGNQNLIIDAKGQRVDLTYDYLDRLENRVYSNHQPGHDGQPIFLQPYSYSYSYDLNGNLQQVTEEKRNKNGEPLEEVTKQAFDPLNRLETKTNPDGKQISYSYDKQGNRASVTDSDNKTTVYHYDARERLKDMTIGSGQITTYAYYPDGLLKKIAYPNGTFEDMDFEGAYDAVGRLMKMINHSGVISDPISQYTYAYDINGNRQYQDEQHRQLGDINPVRTTYAYDDLDRLINVDYGNGAAIAYTYAPNGNRLTEVGTDPTTHEPVDREYVYDRINRLMTMKNHAKPAESVVYEYDANGNTISRNTGQIDPNTGKIANTIGKQFFDYDFRDKLSLVSINGVTTVYFDYDYTGMRTKKTASSGQAVRYLYDQQSVLQEYDPDTLATLRKYNYGTSLHSLVVGGKSNFYLFDGLKSTSEITDESGKVVNSYQYDAWGGMRKEFSLLDNDRKFTGHYLDKETGLQYFGARYYDDTTGRFMTQDPYLGDIKTPPSLHRYLYAYANPLVYIDLQGYEAQTVYDREEDIPVGAKYYYHEDRKCFIVVDREAYGDDKLAYEVNISVAEGHEIKTREASLWEKIKEKVMPESLERLIREGKEWSADVDEKTAKYKALGRKGKDEEQAEEYLEYRKNVINKDFQQVMEKTEKVGEATVDVAVDTMEASNIAGFAGMVKILPFKKLPQSFKSLKKAIQYIPKGQKAGILSKNPHLTETLIMDPKMKTFIKRFDLSILGYREVGHTEHIVLLTELLTGKIEKGSTVHILGPAQPCWLCQKFMSEVAKENYINIIYMGLRHNYQYNYVAGIGHMNIKAIRKMMIPK